MAKKVSITLSEEQYATLKAAAQNQGESMSGILKTVWLDHHKLQNDPEAARSREGIKGTLLERLVRFVGARPGHQRNIRLELEGHLAIWKARKEQAGPEELASIPSYLWDFLVAPLPDDPYFDNSAPLSRTRP